MVEIALMTGEEFKGMRIYATKYTHMRMVNLVASKFPLNQGDKVRVVSSLNHHKGEAIPVIQDENWKWVVK